MKLTKAQVEAVVSEVNDQINRATKNRIDLFKGKADWEKVLLEIKDHNDLEEELTKAREKVEKLEEKFEDSENALEKKIEKFQTKYEVDVDWKWLERGEQPSFTLKFKDLREKIERSVTLLSIDTKEKITSDMLIEKMVSKFTQV
jgi:hypothetical protein